MAEARDEGASTSPPPWERSIATTGRRVADIGFPLLLAVMAVAMLGAAALLDEKLAFRICVGSIGLVVAVAVWLSIVSTPREDTRSSLLERAVQHERRAKATASGALTRRGRVKAAPSPAEPVIVRETEDAESVYHLLRVIAQPFVIETDKGPCLIDTRFIEVCGGTPSVDGYSAIWGELVVNVGDEVYVIAAAEDEAAVGAWLDVEAAGGSFRDHAGTMTRLVGTGEEPLRVWLIPSSTS